MIDCKIVLGRERKPAQTFVQSTTNFACVKTIEDAAIKATVDLPSTMSIEVDEEPVWVEDLTPGTRIEDLVEILRSAPTPPKPDLHWGRFSVKRSSPEQKPIPREFKVIFRDPDFTHRIIATYDFTLLDCSNFRVRQAAYQELRQPSVPDTRT
ncbi:MAG: hypothetical protein K8F91_10090, partial [Candidatus Obscuribacterales bacterium]|nr:hypothetical protein [Candidatus Obscuribacterales bacterium]